MIEFDHSSVIIIGLFSQAENKRLIKLDRRVFWKVFTHNCQGKNICTHYVRVSTIYYLCPELVSKMLRLYIMITPISSYIDKMLCVLSFFNVRQLGEKTENTCAYISLGRWDKKLNFFVLLIPFWSEYDFIISWGLPAKNRII